MTTETIRNVSPDRMSGSPRGREWLALLFVLLSAVWLHSSVVRKPFFADDYFFLEQVRGRSLAAALATPDPLGNFLRPVGRQLYFWTVSRLGSESPVAFHVAGLFVFLTTLVIFHRLARHLGGPVVALTATALIAFHYAADVPLGWASGSQDLLAVLFATVAVFLHVRRRHALSAVALALGLLSKESVALTAAVAMAADFRPGERWTHAMRRATGLVVITGLWAVWWVVTLKSRPATAQTLSFVPSDALAAMVHFVQVALGFEFRAGGASFGHWTLSTPVAALVAVAILWGFAAGHSPSPDRENWGGEAGI